MGPLPTTVLDLHCALADYRLILHELVNIYIFQSVVNFHFAFVQARIFKGQDDPPGVEEVPYAILLEAKENRTYH